MKFLIFAGFALILAGFVPAFAESQQLPTSDGTLEVKISYGEITPGESTPLKIDFINPQTQNIQGQKYILLLQKAFLLAL